jgi:hypothetical protein
VAYADLDIEPPSPFPLQTSSSSAADLTPLVSALYRLRIYLESSLNASVAEKEAVTELALCTSDAQSLLNDTYTGKTLVRQYVDRFVSAVGCWVA